jgi:hypothetical protein
MTFLETLRTRFPAPSPLTVPQIPGTYCLGGALVRMAGWDYEEYSFPNMLTVSNVLQLINPHLDMPQATSYARQILHDNDAGHFSSAWAGLEVALKEGASSGGVL